MRAFRRPEHPERPRRWLTIAGAMLAIMVGVAGAEAASPADHLSSVPDTATSSKAVRPARHHWYQLGVASWYGKFFQGKTTASGQPYDENAMTCAHRSLPLGSLLRVTNLRNHKSVVVRVNDRGPVPENRVIDLSLAAAESLGFSQRGLAPVKVELIGSSTQVAELSVPDNLQPSR
jgi:rare lipoprotein A